MYGYGFGAYQKYFSFFFFFWCALVFSYLAEVMFISRTDCFGRHELITQNMEVCHCDLLMSTKSNNFSLTHMNILKNYVCVYVRLYAYMCVCDVCECVRV